MNIKNQKRGFTPLEVIRLWRMPFRQRNGLLTGFTLLFTLLVINIALTISVGVAYILLEELKLSGTAKDSQIAFYAADSGIECALYWDYGQGGISPSSACLGRDIGNSFSLDFENGSCAVVTVTKTPVGDVTNTTITSRGYNASCGSINNPRTTERGLEVTY